MDSLGQLFTQAASLNPILTDKVLGWALASGGCLLCKAAAGEGPKQQVYVQAAGMGEGRVVQWAKVKSPARAVEKTVRSYKGVSPLCLRAALISKAAFHLSVAIWATTAGAVCFALPVSTRQNSCLCSGTDSTVLFFHETFIFPFCSQGSRRAYE